MEKLKRNLKAISDRMMELWDGKSSDDKDKKKQGKQQGGGGSVVSVHNPFHEEVCQPIHLVEQTI